MDSTNDYNEMKRGLIELLKFDTTDNSQELINLLSTHNLTSSDLDTIDCLLVNYYDKKPHCFLIPYIKSQLGLSFNNDDQCIAALQELLVDMSTTNKSILMDIIEFIMEDFEKELDPHELPQFKLLSLINDLMIEQPMPYKKLKTLYKCLEYLDNIIEL